MVEGNKSSQYDEKFHADSLTTREEGSEAHSTLCTTFRVLGTLDPDNRLEIKKNHQRVLKNGSSKLQQPLFNDVLDFG